MKWCGAMIACNEEPFIKYAIDSTYNFLDSLLIVHGSCEGFKSGSDGLSTDKTKEIIESYPDPKGKIIYDEIGLVKTKNELRNRYMELMPKDTDWILVQDADEMYHDVQLKELDALVEREGDDLALVLNNQYWFWKNFQTYCDYDDKVLRLSSKPTKKGDDFIFEDKYGNLAANGGYHERIFRNLPGLNYDKSHVNVTDEKGEFLYSQGDYRNRRLYLHDHGLRRYHYSYCRPIEDVKNRFNYYVSRDNKNLTTEELNAKVYEDRYFVSLQKGEDELKRQHPELIVKKFEGEHPECMKDHPFMNQTFELDKNE